MVRIFVAAVILVLMSLPLGGCLTSSRYAEFDAVPQDVRACFDRVVAAPALKRGERLTQKRTFQLIADLRRSELEKAGCGKRVVGMWDDYRREFLSAR